MHSRTLFFTFILIAGSLVLPHFVHAAAIPFFGPIIEKSWTVSGTGVQCALGWGAVLSVVNNIIRLLITLAIVLVAPIMIAIAGFRFVAGKGNPGTVTEARKMLTNTVIGIVIALAAWLIVDALIAALTTAADGTTTFARNWSSLITSGNAPACLSQEGIGTGLKQSTNDTGVKVVPTVGPPTVSCATLLYAATLPGITISSTGNCCDKTKPTCTSLEGMRSDTFQQIKNIKEKCGPITVTGGTETGHASEGGAGSHSTGSKVDISQNLISCIQGTSGSSIINPPSFGQSQVKDSCGNVYTWELEGGLHTDVFVTKACQLN